MLTPRRRSGADALSHITGTGFRYAGARAGALLTLLLSRPERDLVPGAGHPRADLVISVRALARADSSDHAIRTADETSRH
jgi:hypothetical protein